ncbi:methyl-accepting chemotaxis protein [Thermodesulfobacteriota bacterium]
MHWRLSIRKKFYAIFAFIILSLLMGVVIGQFSFARVQVGGTLYEGIQLKKDAIFALSDVKANLTQLRGHLYEQSLAGDLNQASSIKELILFIDEDFEILQNQQLQSAGSEVSCGACHPADLLDEVFVPMKEALDKWQILKKTVSARFLSTSTIRDTGEIVGIFTDHFSPVYTEILEDINSCEDVLKTASPQQIDYIINDANTIRLGFIIGGLGMTVFLLITAFIILKHTTKQMSEENAELLETAVELQRVSEEQAAKINLIVNATSEMTLAIDDVARNTSEAHAASEEASDIAQHGKETSSFTIQSIKSGAAVVREAGEIIERLGKHSEEIANVVSVINTLAMQTNLLALNAAVEAARAGEHGQGFSIVADEVKNLAHRSAKATEEIDEMIRYVLTETERSIETITASRSEAEKSVKLIDAVSQSFDAIVTASNNTTRMVEHIAEVSREQAITTEKITESIRNIANIHKNASDAALRLQEVSDSL